MLKILNPAWLWGLITLLIPIAIHLLSRKEGKILPFGSLRFLTESKTNRFRSLRLNEIALLLLRCLLFILLVLYLANFAGYTPEKKNALFIEQGLDSLPYVNKLKDSLLRRNFELLEVPTTSAKQPIEYRAMAEAWTSVYGQVIMVTEQYEKNFHGERISQPDNLVWIPISLPKETSFHSFTTSVGSQRARVGKSNATTTEYVYEEGESSLLKIPDTLNVNIHSSAEFEEDKKILVAALDAIQTVSPYRITTENDKASSRGWNIYLGVTPAARDSVIIYSTGSETSEELLEKDTLPGRKNSWILNHRLTTTGALKHDLIHLLTSILFDEFNSPNKLDVRVIPDPFVWAPRVKPAKPAVLQNEARNNPWLMLAFLLILIAERLLSLKRKQ